MNQVVEERLTRGKLRRTERGEQQMQIGITKLGRQETRNKAKEERIAEKAEETTTTNPESLGKILRRNEMQTGLLKEAKETNPMRTSQQPQNAIPNQIFGAHEIGLPAVAQLAV